MLNTSTLRVGLAALWLAVGAGLLTRHLWDDGGLDARAGGRDLTLFGVVAVALGAWNVLRLWLARPKPRPDLSELIDARRRARGVEVRNPEFDFGEPPTGPRPGA